MYLSPIGCYWFLPAQQFRYTPSGSKILDVLDIISHTLFYYIKQFYVLLVITDVS
jgi:hypothetical protein